MHIAFHFGRVSREAVLEQGLAEQDMQCSQLCRAVDHSREPALAVVQGPHDRGRGCR